VGVARVAKSGAINPEYEERRRVWKKKKPRVLLQETVIYYRRSGLERVKRVKSRQDSKKKKL
jgi:hypothetical protein